ncbi:MAG: hypothetical protein P4L75_05330 [Clostridia bacterium]|nr:hypothetical protein [Clostridia bacterium]
MKYFSKTFSSFLFILVFVFAFSGCHDVETKTRSSSLQSSAVSSERNMIKDNSVNSTDSSLSSQSSAVSSERNMSKDNSVDSTDSSLSSNTSYNSDVNMLNNIIAAASTHNISNIKSALKKYCDKNFAISHNNQKAVFCAQGNSFYNIYYLDFSGTIPFIKNINTINNIKEDVFYTDTWSYDDKYFDINACTDVIGGTLVFNATTLKIIYETTAYMVEGSDWSPSSDSIVLSVPNESVKLNYQGGELEYSTDVVVYNAEKLSTKIVLPANPKYVYVNLVWDNSGITATRHYLDDSTNSKTKIDKLNIFE